MLRNDGGNRQALAGDPDRSASKSNRDGIGCAVKVVSASGLTQYFTVSTAVGYLSASDKRLIVGLGADAAATLVEIRWPSGVVQTFEKVKAGQTLAATEAGSDDHPAPDSCLRCLRAARGRPVRSRRGSRRAASSRSRAASRPAGRSRRASPTSPRRRA